MRLKVMKEYRQRKLANRIMGGKKLRAADTNGLKIVVSQPCMVDFDRNYYDNGNVATLDHENFYVGGIYNSAEELVKAIQNKTGMFYRLKPSEFIFHSGAIRASELVTRFKTQPSNEEIENWKKGSELYTLNLWLLVDVVSDKHRMTEEEAKAFGFGIGY